MLFIVQGKTSSIFSGITVRRYAKQSEGRVKLDGVTNTNALAAVSYVAGRETCGSSQNTYASASSREAQ